MHTRTVNAEVEARMKRESQLVLDVQKAQNERIAKGWDVFTVAWNAVWVGYPT